jgi:hypothetical protein
MNRIITILMFMAVSVSAQIPDSTMQWLRQASVPRVSAGTTPSGGNDEFTKLLLHMDGTNGSTTFIDSSAVGNTVSVFGSAAVSTNAKVGTGSFLAQTATNNFLSVPDSANWAFSTNQFTIDFWVKVINAGATRQVVAQSPDATHIWSLQLRYSTIMYITFVNYNGGSPFTQLDVPFIPTTNTNIWYHVAVVRVSNENTTNGWRFFINGTNQAITKTTGNWNDSLTDYAARLTIGKADNQTDVPSYYLDELRISNTARWTTNFVPVTIGYGEWR